MVKKILKSRVTVIALSFALLLGLSIGGVRVAASSTADINGDGTVDLSDVTALVAHFGSTGTGDVNGDGKVNIVDLSIVLSSFGSTTTTPVADQGKINVFYRENSTDGGYMNSYLIGAQSNATKQTFVNKHYQALEMFPGDSIDDANAKWYKHGYAYYDSSAIYSYSRSPYDMYWN